MIITSLVCFQLSHGLPKQLYGCTLVFAFRLHYSCLPFSVPTAIFIQQNFTIFMGSTYQSALLFVVLSVSELFHNLWTNSSDPVALLFCILSTSLLTSTVTGLSTPFDFLLVHPLIWTPYPHHLPNIWSLLSAGFSLSWLR